MNKPHQTGFSLIEVMIASLLMSIIMISFLGYQKVLFHQQHYLSNFIQAQQIAFQLLDSYPEIASHLVPDNWQFDIHTESYLASCKMVSITIMPPNQKQVKQQRLFCNN